MAVEGEQKPGEFSYCFRCPAQTIRRDGASMEKICDLSKLDGVRHRAPASCKIPMVNAAHSGSQSVSTQKMVGDLIRRLRE